MYNVRNSVKAIIVQDNKLLCIKLSDKDGNYYILPGGGQEKNETFIETLKRECLEELGAEIEVQKIRYIREYIGKNHEFAHDDDNHQVEYMFACKLLSEPDLSLASHLDNRQEGFEWVELEKRENFRVYPKILTKRLSENYEEIYWGDIN